MFLFKMATLALFVMFMSSSPLQAMEFLKNTASKVRAITDKAKDGIGVHNPRNDLFNAAKSGDEKAFKGALIDGASLLDLDDDGCSPLHWAILGKHTELIHFIMQYALDHFGQLPAYKDSSPKDLLQLHPLRPLKLWNDPILIKGGVATLSSHKDALYFVKKDGDSLSCQYVKNGAHLFGADPRKLTLHKASSHVGLLEKSKSETVFAFFDGDSLSLYQLYWASGTDFDMNPIQDLVLLVVGKTVRVFDFYSVGPHIIYYDAPIHQAIFSSDGSTIVTVAEDKTLITWNLKGKKVKILAHDHPVLQVCCSPDLTYIVGMTADYCVLWKEWKFSKKLPRGTPVFSFDGSYLLIAGQENFAYLENLDTHEILSLVHAGPIRSAVFSPDTRFVATASDDKTVVIWDLKGQKYAVLPNAYPVVKVEYNLSGNHLLVVTDSEAMLWDVQAINPLQDVGADLGLKTINASSPLVKDTVQDRGTVRNERSAGTVFDWAFESAITDIAQMSRFSKESVLTTLVKLHQYCKMNNGRIVDFCGNETLVKVIHAAAQRRSHVKHYASLCSVVKFISEHARELVNIKIAGKTALAWAEYYQLEEIITLLAGVPSVETPDQRREICIMCNKHDGEKCIADCGHRVCSDCTKKELRACPHCHAPVTQWLNLKPSDACICCLNPIKVACVAVPCGHTLICYSCAEKLTECPLPGCRASVTAWRKYA
jgi:WD40 repeat protein/predicted RNA-binding Zn ribbon-like protein